MVIDEHIIRKYLLGELKIDEYERIEERLLTDNNFFERLTALEDEVEDELIDQYVSGELTNTEREKFERKFLCTPERNEKLKLARDLREYVARQKADARTTTAAPVDKQALWWPSLPAFLRFQHPLIGPSLAFALLLAVLCSVWLFIKSNRLETDLKRLQAQKQSPVQDEQLEQLRARNEELAASLQRSEEQRVKLEQEVATLKTEGEQMPETPGKTLPPQPRTPIYSLILPLTRGRGSDGEKIKVLNLPSGAAQVQLILSLETIGQQDYKDFQVIIEKRDGTEVWKSNGIRVRPGGSENQAIVTLPASRLPGGDYTVELNGLTAQGISEPIGIYSFRVITK